MVVCLIRGEIVLSSMGKAVMAEAMTHGKRGEGSPLHPTGSLGSLETATARRQAKPRSIRLKFEFLS